MRRILSLVMVALMMAAMMLVMAMPALAGPPVLPGQCVFDKETGRTICTEKVVSDTGTFQLYTDEWQEWCGDGTWAWVYEEAYQNYTQYEITTTTYAGKGPRVLDQTVQYDYETWAYSGGYKDVYLSGGCNGRYNT